VGEVTVNVVRESEGATGVTFPVIKGFVETSLVDWDSYISAVIFLGHCNFACPFCHDHELLTGTGPTVPFESVEAMLLAQGGWVDGVVITGGEPTSNTGILDLLERLKSLGLMVKLDTNGSNPEMMREMEGGGLVDYVAMDIKAALSREPVDSAGARKYDLAAGRAVDIDAIEESIDSLLGGDVDYEFRTTLVPTMIGRSDVENIARRIAGARGYFLQPFEPSHARSPLLRKVHPYAPNEMSEMLAIARKYVPDASLRGKMKSSS
jgi:pyruvate formate lyase activating enzyme